MLAEQRVDESRFARVELADDHEQEKLIELEDCAVELRHVIRVGIQRGQRMAQRHQLAALGLQDPLVIFGQKAIQHRAISLSRRLRRSAQ